MASFGVDRVHNALRGLLAPLDDLASLVRDGASVLELGCGQGLLLEALASRAGRLVGIDYDARKVRMARELLGDRAEIAEADIVSYLDDVRPGEFDCLILSDTLSSFLPEDQDAVLELVVSRLGANGRLILSFVDAGSPIKSAISRAVSRITYGMRVSKSHGQRFTYRSAGSLRAVLEGAGCVVEQHAFHRFPPRLMPHVALVARPQRPDAIPSVVFAVLNLRVGGQVSGLSALAESLRARGIAVRWALPAGDEPTKEQVDAFASLAFSERRRRIWRMLRGLRPARDDDVLHLVLPSPAFAPLAVALRWPEERIVLQYEGPALSLSGEVASALAREPAFVAPRLVLNHRGWARVARRLRVTHLASHPAICRQLQRLRYSRVSMIENLADVRAEDALAERVVLDRASGQCWVAYIGHSHSVKGVDLLLAAFEQAADQRRDLHLLLALTRDGAASALRARAQRSRHADRIRLAGLVRVNEVLSAVDALVLPYRSALTTTLYPSLLLEADAARCPVIVSRLPELAPILAWDSPCLTVVTPGDRASLVDALVAVEGRSARSWTPLLSLKSPDERIDSFVELYESLVR